MFGQSLRALVASLIVVAMLGACTSGSVNAPGPSGPAQAAASLETGYRLGSGDRIRVSVFRHPDLSGEFGLDGGGNFAMPLVGEVAAAGLTPRELEQRLATQLRDGYINDPQVGIEVVNFRPFYILGEINNPGSYPYVNGMTVLNAVALAGGFSYRAKQNGIIIRRGGSNTDGVVATGNETILPGDVIEVPERFF